MKLTDYVRNEEEILSLEVDELAIHLLACLADYPAGSLKRRGLAEAFMREYPRESMDSIYAIEESLMWLEKELLIGQDPHNPEKIFLTRKALGILKNRQDAFSTCAPIQPSLVFT